MFCKDSLCRRWYKSFLIVVMIGVTSGCSVKLVYNQLDWLIPWYVSDYLDMNGEQDAFFEERLALYLDWHRKEQLPEYAAFLREVATDVQDGLSVQEVQKIQQQTERLGGEMMERLAPDVISLFASAEDDQLDALFKAMDKDSVGFRRRSVEVSLSEQRKKRVADVIDTVERWTGSLSDDQTLLVDQWGGRYEPMNRELYEAGKLWREEFKQTLALRGQVNEYRKRFHTLLTTPDFGWSGEIKEKATENKQLLSELYFTLDKSFSSKQREHIVDMLQSYADDFEHLAKEE